MRAWVQWVAILTLVLCPTCGGGGEPQVEEPCGPVLGRELVQPLLDVHSQQVMIEVNIVTVDDAFLETLGVSFPNILPVDQGRPWSSRAGSYCGGSAGVATGVVGGAEGDLVVLPQGTSGSQGLPRIANAPVTPLSGAQVFSTMPGPGEFDVLREEVRFWDDSGLVPPGNVIAPLLTVAGGYSFRYALTDDAGLDLFLTEVLGDADTRVVSAPKVVTLDGQEATIFVGTERPYVTELTFPVREGVLAVNPAAEFAEVGVTLHVTPSIPQSGFIRMTIQPESTALVVDSPPLSLGGGPSVIARTPVLHPSDAQADLLMNDGNTAILGGLRDDTTLVETTGVPVLGELPVIGAFFREYHQLDLRDDLIVLIRGRIIQDD